MIKVKICCIIFLDKKTKKMDKIHELFQVTKVKYGKNFLTIQVQTIAVSTVRKIEEVSRGKSSLEWTIVHPNEVLTPNTITQLDERSYFHQIHADESLRLVEENLAKTRYDMKSKKPKR